MTKTTAPVDYLVCTSCAAKIPLSEAMAKRFEQELHARFDAELAARTEATRTQAERAAAANIDAVRHQLRLEHETRLATAQRELTERAAAREVELLRQNRELAEARAQHAIELERRVNETLEQARREAAQRLADELRRAHELAALRDVEQKQKMEGLQRSLDALQQRLVQSSQQAQGEAQEEALRTLLERLCPFDQISDIPLGKNGADLLQRVVDGQTGRDAGSILWECKRTKAWSDSWLPKLRDDQRQSKADLAILVTQAMPSDVKIFGERDGVWIVAWPYVGAFVALLRSGLLRVAHERSLVEHQADKMALLYRYLTGAEFAARMSGALDNLCRMQEALGKEQLVMKKIWKARESELEAALMNLLSVQADVRRIGGPAMPAIVTLDDGDGTALPQLLPERAS